LWSMDFQTAKIGVFRGVEGDTKTGTLNRRASRLVAGGGYTQPARRAVGKSELRGEFGWAASPTPPFQ